MLHLLVTAALAEPPPRSTADLDAVLAAAGPSFEACHEADVDVRATFTVKPDGTVERVDAVGPIEPSACLEERLAALPFPAADAVETRVSYQVTLTAAGAAFSAPVILGWLDKSEIDAVVKRHLGEVSKCYRRALWNHPTLAGKLTVKFVVAQDGTVSSSTTKETTLNDEAVETCIHERFRSFVFPAPHGGGVVIVAYPLVFSP